MSLSQAEGCISKAEDRLRNMLAACQPLQAWMGVASASAAKDRIYLVTLPPSSNANEGEDGNYQLSEIQSKRPFVLIWTPTENAFHVHLDTETGGFTSSGVLRARFEENVPDHLGDNYPEAYRRFLNTIGKIIHSGERHNPGLMELRGELGCAPDHLAFHDIDVVDHMRTTSDDAPTMGDAHKCEMEIHWGATT